MYIVLYFLASMNMNLILYSQVPSSDRILKVQVNNIVWTPLSHLLAWWWQNVLARSSPTPTATFLTLWSPQTTTSPSLTSAGNSKHHPNIGLSLMGCKIKTKMKMPSKKKIYIFNLPSKAHVYYMY